MLGVSSTTVEVNPYLADVIRAKLATYNVDSLIDNLEGVRRRVRRRPDAIERLGALPPTFVEPGKKDRFLFDAATAGRLGPS